MPGCCAFPAGSGWPREPRSAGGHYLTWTNTPPSAIWNCGGSPRSNPTPSANCSVATPRAVHAVCFWRTASAATAEDLTSVVFLEAWRLRDRVTITGESVLPWLLGVANNCARNAERSARRYRQALERLPRVDARSDEDEQVDRLDAEVSMSIVKRSPRCAL